MESIDLGRNGYAPLSACRCRRRWDLRGGGEGGGWLVEQNVVG